MGNAVLETLLTARSETIATGEVTADRTSPPAGALGLAAVIARYLILATLLAVELTHFGLPILLTASPSLQGWWWPAISNARAMVEAGLGAAIATIFFSWPVFIEEVRAASAKQSWSDRAGWIAANILCALGILTWLILGTRESSRAFGVLWFFGGVGIFVGAIISWCIALFPPEFWANWFRRNPGAFAAGAAVGILTRLVGYLAQILLYPLQRYTLWTVVLMLRLLGQTTVVDAGLQLVGTPKFSVWIAPTCSGLEGIGLICAFLGFYLWYFRAELRFPLALVLVPAGVAIIWTLNALRIALLILLGGHLEQSALEGFHSVAGWILFNATAIALITVSRRTGLFSKARREQVSSHPNPAAPYLVPIAVMTALALLTVPFSHGFDFAYPARLIVTAGAIWWYRDRLGSMLWGFSWPAVAVGALVFVVWMLLFARANSAQASAAFAASLRGISVVAASAWLLSRVAGAAVVTPIVEELAFRGYLLRKLGNREFETAAYQDVSLFAVVASSILFGLLQQHWVAGIFAGMIFAAAARYRGKLSDAICVHATANAMLALYVIITGSWSLWS